MKEKPDNKFTVRVADSIQKSLHSRDSADRLVRAVVGLWRGSSDGPRKSPATLVLDFQGIQQLSESAASVFVEFRREFSEDKNPEIIFSNLSGSVRKVLESVERPLRRSANKIGNAKKKRSRFTIEI